MAMESQVTLRRTAVWCGAGLAALLAVAALAVALAVHRPRLVRPWVERALAPRGGTASLAGLSVSLAPPSVELSGLEIAGPPREGYRLRLDRLRFELIPRAFLQGGPRLRRVEAGGLVFDRPLPREAKGPPDLTPLARLFDIEELSLTDARLRVALPQGDLEADGVRINLIPGEEGVRSFRGHGKLGFRLGSSIVAEGELSARGKIAPGPALEVDLETASARLMLPWLTGDVSGRAGLRVTPDRFHVEELTLTMPEGRADLAPRAVTDLGAIRLDAAASATLMGREPRLELRGLDIEGLLRARGRLGGPTLEEMSGSLEGEIPRVERLKTALAPLLPPGLRGMDLAGSLPFSSRLSGRGTERALALELHPRGLRFSWRKEGLDCLFGGTLRADGTLQGWRRGEAVLAGRIEGTGRFERPPLAVRRFRFDAPLAGKIAAPTLPGWKTTIGAGDVAYEGRPLPLGTLELGGLARVADASYRVENLEIRSDSLGRLAGELAYEGGSLDVRLDGVGLPADNLAVLARASSGRELDRWSPTGAIDLAARFEPSAGGSRVTATATFAQIGFHSPAGDVLGQNLAGNVALEALMLPQPRMNAELTVRGGEALWGTVYLNLAKVPLNLRAGGRRVGHEEYQDLTLECGLAGFGRLTIEGKAHHAKGIWHHQGHLLFREARLGPIFRTFLRDPLAASLRGLAGLEMDGTAEVALSFAGSGQAADLAGSLRLRSGNLQRGAEPPYLSGLDIDLPIAYSLGAVNPGHPEPSDAARWGRLRLENLRPAGQELGPLEMPVVLVPNRLYLGGAIDTSLFGAGLSLRRIRVDEPLSPDFRIHMAVRLDRLDLARVAGESVKLEGRLEGLLDPVVIGRKRMTAAGELNGDLFGGRLKVRDVTVERPFSAGREIGANVDVDRIDLERLSEALGIGRITGRLSGSIEGLRVAYGQPVAFHLRMESVPTKGVSRKVSLKAVNSISLVSTGSALSGLGVSMMTTFFKEFPYEKIGVESGLKNDVFTLRGTIHEDGVEYLVKRRFFGGINVINRNPDNRIGFSDMVERARRVTGERSH